MIQGPGVGILDVISPTRLAKLENLDAAQVAQKLAAGIQAQKQQAFASTVAPAGMTPDYTPNVLGGRAANYSQSLQSMQP